MGEDATQNPLCNRFWFGCSKKVCNIPYYHKMIRTGVFQNSSVSQFLLFLRNLAELGGRAMISHARSLPRIHKHDPLTRLQGCPWPCEWVNMVMLICELWLVMWCFTMNIGLWKVYVRFLLRQRQS